MTEAADMKALGWTLGKELGSGHFAKVKLVTRDSDGVTAAVKIIKKPKGAQRAQRAADGGCVMCTRRGRAACARSCGETAPAPRGPARRPQCRHGLDMWRKRA